MLYVWTSAGAIRPELYYEAWIEWFEATPRHVADTFLQSGDCGVRISTVFLGVDISTQSELYLWETMVFPLQQNGSVDYTEIDGSRTGSLAEAVAYHERCVREWTWWITHTLGRDAPAIQERTGDLHPVMARLRASAS